MLRVRCVFFFFKQKTAYELRISDWSSDVCSSDLVKEHSQALACALDTHFQRRDTHTRERRHLFVAELLDVLEKEGFPLIVVQLQQRQLKIARASCREGVCKNG